VTGAIFFSGTLKKGHVQFSAQDIGPNLHPF